MQLPDLTKLISQILAISIAGERLVTLLKTIIPPLASPPPSASGMDNKKDIPRQAAVMIIAFLACWLTAELAKIDTTISRPLLGLLASGGSAFWTSILNYARGVKDVKVQQGLQERINTTNKTSEARRAAASSKETVALQQAMALHQPDFKA